jgi:hypothetical protein
MTRKILVSVVLIGAASMAAAGPRGTVPKAAVGEYAAHAERNGLGVGATLLTSDQVHKKFAADVNHCCVVVEIAIYPQKDKTLDVSLDDITIQTESDGLVRPLSARAVAAKLQEQAERGRTATVATSAGVGYESGTYIDPVTGQPRQVHGVTTEAGVGVGVGDDPYPRPGASNRSRDNAEIELSEQSLPEGSAAAPVAGYIFFSSSVKKSKKKVPMQLQYALKDQTVVLNLDAKK